MQLSEAMKMMGLGDFLHWCAWFLEFVFVFMAITLVMVMVWKFGRIFPYSHLGLMFSLFIVYAMAFASFCFLISSLFNKSDTATIFVLLIWCLSFVPYFLAWNSSLSVKYLAGLSLNTAVYFFIDILYNYESLEQGVQPRNFHDPPWFEHNISVADCFQMLAIDFALYTLLAWYLSNVFPGRYGIPVKWYFPLSVFFRYSALPVAGTFESGENFEKGPEGKLATIKIIGLTKIYSNATVGLDAVNMNVYNNEITVLLGENGAGKSTLLSVLTGLYPPTTGTATINDYDIRDHMDFIHESLGVCPQTDILFNLLTVEEHLIFFSKLKGCGYAEAKYEANKYITQLDLTDKTNTLVRSLSLGMKRKLCLAIALCGDSKIVLADEPTSGMDPNSRKAVWDLLQVEKYNRLILMSTHNMEEADVLADRVAILNNGKLTCYGTPKFLKDLYGGSQYKLVIMMDFLKLLMLIISLQSCEKSETSDIKAITETIQRYVPKASVTHNMASELTFKLDETYRIKFPLLLAEIEGNATRLGLHGYGISLNEMEDVFFA